MTDTVDVKERPMTDTVDVTVTTTPDTLARRLSPEVLARIFMFMGGGAQARFFAEVSNIGVFLWEAGAMADQIDAFIDKLNAMQNSNESGTEIAFLEALTDAYVRRFGIKLEVEGADLAPVYEKLEKVEREVLTMMSKRDEYRDALAKSLKRNDVLVEYIRQIKSRAEQALLTGPITERK